VATKKNVVTYPSGTTSVVAYILRGYSSYDHYIRVIDLFQ